MSVKKRSYTMSQIRSKGTLIEKQVFKALKKKKILFQKHYAKLPGKPDVVLVKKKLAVFIDGDFWHGWRFKVWKSRIPKKYWQLKIERNILRDKKNRRLIKSKGWKVLKVWEHQLQKNYERTIEKIVAFLTKQD